MVFDPNSIHQLPGSFIGPFPPKGSGMGPAFRELIVSCGPLQSAFPLKPEVGVVGYIQPVTFCLVQTVLTMSMYIFVGRTRTAEQI